MDALLGATPCDSAGGGNPLAHLADGLTDQARVREQMGAGMVHGGAATPPNAADVGRTMVGEGAKALGMFAQPEPEPAELPLGHSRAQASRGNTNNFGFTRGPGKTWQDRWVRAHKPELAHIDGKRPLSALDLGDASARPRQDKSRQTSAKPQTLTEAKQMLALMKRGKDRLHARL